MRKITDFFKRAGVVALVAGLGIGLWPAAAAQAATRTEVREAQVIMTKFGLPTGAVDGLYGPNTARALCAFRQMSGLPVSRSTVDAALLAKLRSYNTAYASLASVPAASLNGHATYLLAQKQCQAMLYVENGRYQRIMPMSTGMRGHDTPNGIYSLSSTRRGWSCSTIYPESCNYHAVGRFVGISDYGNMYNKRFFRSGGYYVHGSTAVPTYPASHGCIRVPVSDSDWMYDHVGNYGPTYFMVTGAY